MIVNLASTLMVFLIIIIFVPSQRSLGELKLITIMTENWKDCTNPDGTGLYFDLIRVVYPEYKIKYIIAPYKRSIHCCSVGNVDMSVGAYENEVGGVIYPKNHFFNDETSVVFLKKTQFKGLESLTGKRVLWLRGYSYNKYIDQPMVFFEQDNQSKALRLVKLGFFEFYIGPKVMIDKELDRNTFDQSTIKWIKMYMVYSPTSKGEELSNIWDRNFAALLKKGIIKKLFKKYGMLRNYRF